jgi:DNA-binding transcriptional LysR family regulator
MYKVDRQIRHIPFFVAVCEEGSLQRAAQRLHMAQSALSRRIQELETELECGPLFVRTGHGVSPTPSGLVMYEIARRILADFGDARMQAQSVTMGTAGRIRLGFTGPCLRLLILENIGRLANDELSDLQVDMLALNHDTLVKAVTSGSVHAGLIFGAHDFPEDISFISIGSSPFLLAMAESNPLRHKTPLLLEDVAQSRFIWFSSLDEPSIHRAFVDLFRQRGVIPRLATESPSIDTTLRWVALGVALAFVPATVAASPESGVALRDVQDFSLDLEFSLIWPRSRPHPAILRLISLVRASG